MQESSGAGAEGGAWRGGCAVDENEICFWNMHGQWNKTKGEGERVRQESVQKGARKKGVH